MLLRRRPERTSLLRRRSKTAALRRTISTGGLLLINARLALPLRAAAQLIIRVLRLGLRDSALHADGAATAAEAALLLLRRPERASLRRLPKAAVLLLPTKPAAMALVRELALLLINARLALPVRAGAQLIR